MVMRTELSLLQGGGGGGRNPCPQGLPCSVVGGCPQKVPCRQRSVPLALPLRCAAPKPRFPANAQRQAAFCVGVSRKLIPAPCQEWVCGRAPAFARWAGTKLLIRSPGSGCQGHPKGDLETCLVLIPLLLKPVEAPEFNTGALSVS